MRRSCACARPRRSPAEMTWPASAGGRGWIAAGTAVSILLCACSHLERQPHERRHEPLEAELLAEMRPRHPGHELSLEAVNETRAYQRYIFRFQAYCDLIGDYKQVSGDYYLARAALNFPAPLLVMAPILAGPVDDYRATRYFCERACEAGMSSFFIHQETSILDTGRDAADLEARMRENIRDNITALDLFCERPEVDGRRLGSLGISLGAIKNVVLIATEPRLRANVLLLAGADLPRMLRESKEALVLQYLAARRTRDGMSTAEVVEEFRRHFRSDPLHFAPAVENDRVLLILGRLDNKVPYATGLLLREMLGEPETYIVPFGHYTSVLAAPWAATRSLEWIAKRFGDGDRPRDDIP
jgi:dienelactone hydrolase